MEKVVVEAMMKAYKCGFLKVEDLFSLQKIKIENSNRPVKSMGGKITYRSREKNYSIVIYGVSIKKWYDQGCKFNGIKPENMQHALDLVIEHEIGHVIAHYNGGKGHDSKFRSIVKKCFNHTEWRIK